MARGGVEEVGGGGRAETRILGSLESRTRDPWLIEGQGETRAAVSLKLRRPLIYLLRVSAFTHFLYFPLPLTSDYLGELSMMFRCSLEGATIFLRRGEQGHAEIGLED